MALLHRIPTLSRLRAASLVATAALGLFSYSTVHAAPIIDESFTSPVGSLPAGWVLQKPDSKTSDSVGRISTEASGNWLKLWRQTASGGSKEQAAVYYNGTAAGITDGNLGDFKGAVTVSIPEKGAGSIRGVVVRAQEMSYGDFNGYFLAFDKNGVGIWYNPTDHVAHGERLAYTTYATPLSNLAEYRLVFSVIGSQLAVELTSIDQSVILASASVDLTEFGDVPNHTDGYFALRAGFATSDYALFKDLEIQAIPEPQAALLPLGGALIVGTFLLRRKTAMGSR